MLKLSVLKVPRIRTHNGKQTLCETMDTSRTKRTLSCYIAEVAGPLTGLQLSLWRQLRDNDESCSNCGNKII